METTTATTATATTTVAGDDRTEIKLDAAPPQEESCCGPIITSLKTNPEKMKEKKDDGMEASSMAAASSAIPAAVDSSSSSSKQQKQQKPKSSKTSLPLPESLPESPFVTTSSVLKHLNQALADMGENVQMNAATAVPRGGFELQKRLPDGSSRKATETEQAAADAQTKLQQVAAHVALLNATERLDFAHAQRTIGNAYYAAGNYKEAIDVYLTSLLAIQPQLPPSTMAAKRTKQCKQHQIINLPDDMDEDVEDVDEGPSFPLPSASQQPTTTTRTTASTPSTTTTTTPVLVSLNPQEQQIHLLLFFKIMNNLALSSLHLGWYHKTEQFCNIALEQVETNDEHDNKDIKSEIHGATTTTAAAAGPAPESFSLSSLADPEIDPALERLQQVAKLYYKRAKARRLRGLYKQARLDLNTTNQWIERQEQHLQEQQLHQQPATAADTDKSVQEQRRAVQKEEQLLTLAVAEGKRNKERAQRAMQRILNSNSDSTTSAITTRATTGTAEMDKTTASSSSSSSMKDTTLYPEASQPKQNRGYSTLRAPPRGNNSSNSSTATPPVLSEPFEESFRTSSHAYELERQDQRLLVEALDATSFVARTKLYWRIYLVMVGRVAQQLLEWIGEDDDEEHENDKDDDHYGHMVVSDVDNVSSKPKRTTTTTSTTRVHFKDD